MISVTASDPERAARLANWIASEYLRGRLREQAIEAYAAAEREMTALSSVFGPHHPSYLNGWAKLERLKAELAAAREGVVTKDGEAAAAQDMIRFAAGQSLLPAEAVMLPSGPNAMLLFALTIVAALAVAILLCSLAERGLFRWPVPIPAALWAWSPALLTLRDLWWRRHSMFLRLLKESGGAFRSLQSFGRGRWLRSPDTVCLGGEIRPDDHAGDGCGII
jgi:hypothetical protein